MKRYLSFLDIHGFKNLVFDNPLDEITRRLGEAIRIACYAECLGGIKEIDGLAHPDESLRSIHRFSFSDSFVFASKDALVDSLNSIIVSTCLMAQGLFAMQLPVRGAIVAGEADFVPDTDHLVGRGVIEAIELEAQQDWYGIMLDPALGSYEHVASMLHPGVLPMVVRYPIPLKTGEQADGIAVNWRLNITAEIGTRRFFRPAADEAQQRKLDHTLAFAKHVRDTGQAYTPLAYAHPWLRPVYLPATTITDLPATIELRHGDEF